MLRGRLSVSLIEIVNDPARRIEVGFAAAAAVLCALLWRAYTGSARPTWDELAPGSAWRRSRPRLRRPTRRATTVGEHARPRADPDRRAAAAIGLAAAKVADRVRVPGLLLFLGLGMLAGSEGIGGVEFDDAELTRTLGNDRPRADPVRGRLSAGWTEIRPVLGTAVLTGDPGHGPDRAITGAVAIWLFDLGTLEGLILGSAVAATDSAAIFAALRGSRLRRRLARALEGESGMNDPVALLLVVGFIDWIEMTDYGADDMALTLAGKLALGLAIGFVVGHARAGRFATSTCRARGCTPSPRSRRRRSPTAVAEIVHGSGSSPCTSPR